MRDHHHGMSEMEGMHAFCEQGYEGRDEDRFGRIFSEPPLYVPPEELHELGAEGGPMDQAERSEPVERTDTVPVGQIFFGQFVDHDITLDTTSSLSANADPSSVPNVRTPTLDLDNIYGLGPEAHPFLYHDEGEYAGIKLLTGANGTAADQEEELAAFDLQRSPHGRAIIGDHRNDENRIISQLQLAMIRFHNAVAEYVKEEEEVEGAEEIFEEARRLATWHYQYVVVEDFLPKVCGQAVVNEIQGQGRTYFCSPSDTPFIPIEFAVAAYRFGHSMMPQTVQVQRYCDEFPLFGPTLGNGFTPLDTPDAVVDWDVLVDTAGDNVVQYAEQLDTQMASLLLNLPFINEGVASLANRNLLRGQVFLLPSGEEVARAMGRAESEIERISETAQELAGPEVNLDNGTPLWFYILVEAERKGRETEPGHFEEGEGLGPVGARIVAETLYGLIELDDRSYLSTNRNWSPQRNGVGVTTLGEMLTYGENPVPSE